MRVSVCGGRSPFLSLSIPSVSGVIVEGRGKRARDTCVDVWLSWRLLANRSLSETLSRSDSGTAD